MQLSSAVNNCEFHSKGFTGKMRMAINGGFSFQNSHRILHVSSYEASIHCRTRLQSDKRSLPIPCPVHPTVDLLNQCIFKGCYRFFLRRHTSSAGSRQTQGPTVCAKFSANDCQGFNTPRADSAALRNRTHERLNTQRAAGHRRICNVLKRERAETKTPPSPY